MKKKTESLLSFDEPSPKKEEPKTKEQPKDSKKPKVKRKKVAHDEFISVSFNPKVLPHDSTHIDIPLHLEKTFLLSILLQLNIQFKVQ